MNSLGSYGCEAPKQQIRHLRSQPSVDLPVLDLRLDVAYLVDRRWDMDVILDGGARDRYHALGQGAVRCRDSTHQQSSICAVTARIPVVHCGDDHHILRIDQRELPNNSPFVLDRLRRESCYTRTRLVFSIGTLMSVYNFTRVEEAKHIPTTEHWAVLLEESVCVDTGYPEDSGYRKTYFSYLAFLSEADLHDWVKEQETKSRQYSAAPVYRVMFVKPASVQKEISIIIK